MADLVPTSAMTDMQKSDLW